MVSAHSSSMAIPSFGCRCKTWNIARPGRLAKSPARRKIQVMAAQFQPEEQDDSDGLGQLEEDAAALRDLVQEVRLNRPLQAGEQEILLGRAALGYRQSQDRLVAANLAMVIRLAVARKE